MSEENYSCELRRAAAKKRQPASNSPNSKKHLCNRRCNVLSSRAHRPPRQHPPDERCTSEKEPSRAIRSIRTEREPNSERMPHNSARSEVHWVEGGFHRVRA